MIQIEPRHLTLAALKRAKRAREIEMAIESALRNNETISAEQLSNRFLLSESAIEKTLSEIGRNDFRRLIGKGKNRQKKLPLSVGTRIAVLRTIIKSDWDWLEVSKFHGETASHWSLWFAQTYSCDEWRRKQQGRRPDWDLFIRQVLDREIHTEESLRLECGVEFKCERCKRTAVQSEPEDWESILG